MKIAFIGGRDIRSLGGIENYMYNLATQLKMMGHEPVVFCESDHNAQEFVNGFQVILVKGVKNKMFCKPLVSLKATLRIVLKMRDVDMIHYNAWPPSLASPIATIFGIKSLLMGHGHGWQRTYISPRARKIVKFMEKVTAHLNRNLLMCSEAQCRYFKQHYGREAICIPTAINLPEPVRETDILSRFNLERGRYFLFLARLVQDKNPDFLIRGFRKARHDGYKLVIAGNNPAAPEYVELLHKLAEDDPDVVFTDAVFGDDKETLLRNAFAFCIPSTIEGLSISLLEAMSRRLPVIASDIPANREVLGDEDALWVKPECDEDITLAVERALREKDIIKSTVERNYNTVACDYTWPKVANKYIKVISKF